jgi:hypothetical protein
MMPVLKSKKDGGPGHFAPVPAVHVVKMDKGCPVMPSVSGRSFPHQVILNRRAILQESFS